MACYAGAHITKSKGHQSVDDLMNYLLDEIHDQVKKLETITVKSVEEVLRADPDLCPMLFSSDISKLSPNSVKMIGSAFSWVYRGNGRILQDKGNKAIQAYLKNPVKCRVSVDLDALYSTPLFVDAVEVALRSTFTSWAKGICVKPTPNGVSIELYIRDFETTNQQFIF